MFGVCEGVFLFQTETCCFDERTFSLQNAFAISMFGRKMSVHLLISCYTTAGTTSYHRFATGTMIHTIMCSGLLEIAVIKQF